MTQRSIVALNAPQYSGGADCGKSITITNTDNGQTATATIVDECPGCGSGSLDLVSADSSLRHSCLPLHGARSRQRRVFAMWRQAPSSS